MTSVSDSPVLTSEEGEVRKDPGPVLVADLASAWLP